MLKIHSKTLKLSKKDEYEKKSSFVIEDHGH